MTGHEWPINADGTAAGAGVNEFEYYISLLGLLMGLSLIEVISGAVRALRARQAVRLGLLTPLLALFVLLDVTSYWENAWQLNRSMPVNFLTIYAGLFVAGLYYFAASFVFPERIEAGCDLDDHFMKVRRTVLLPLAVLNLPLSAALAWEAARSDEPLELIGVLYFLGHMVVFVSLIVVAALARSRRLIAGLLTSASALYLCGAALVVLESAFPNAGLRWYVLGQLLALAFGFGLGWTLHGPDPRSAEAEPPASDHAKSADEQSPAVNEAAVAGSD